MKLTVNDVSKLLAVSEKIVYDWIYNEELPAYKMNDQFRINQTELMEWAASRKIPVPSAKVRHAKGLSNPTLAQALEKGGIVYNVKGKDKSSALKAVVEVMKLPSGMSRDNLLSILMAREALASTGVGNGLAIPHVRNPIVLPILYPTVTLCFLETPIDFGALDGKPVHTLFTLLSPTIHAHLYLISRLSFALHDQQFKKIVEERGTREDIMKVLRLVEDHFELPPQKKPKF